jgi:hypothetical protein
MKSLKKAAVAALAGMSVLVGAPASAAMILGFQETGPGTITGSGTVNVFSVPGSGFYGDTFGTPTTTITASPLPGYGFYDDFIFSIPTGASADSITSTISLSNVLSVNNLDVRLYNATGNSPLPVLGTPVGTVIDGTLTNVGGGMVDTLSATLAAGTYVLEVRGNVTGTSGGSYSGTLNVAPVPLPAALPLLLVGLGGLGALLRQRRAPF